MCLQVVGGVLYADCVLFVERACELQYAARLSCVSGAEAKASLNRAYKLYAVDPKLSELSMARVKRR